MSPGTWREDSQAHADVKELRREIEFKDKQIQELLAKVHLRGGLLMSALGELARLYKIEGRGPAETVYLVQDIKREVG